MASCISPKDRDLYPYNETITLFSSAAGKASASDIGALMAYLQGLGDDTDKPAVRKLEPISSIEAMTNRSEIFLQSIEFVAFDTAKKEIEVPESEEESEEAEESSKIYANEQIVGNVVTSMFLPNFFRPSVRIGSEDVTSGLANPANAPFHDLAIGLPLPYCLQINKVIKDPNKIEIFAAYSQAFQAGGSYKFRNYPIMAIVSFWHSLR
jgi:hypothetical protein